MRTPPNREIDFDCACVACVRACVRAKLRERGVSSVARVGRTDLGGRGGVHTALRNFKVNLLSCKSVCYASKRLAKRLSTSPRLGGLMLPEIPCFSEDLGLAPPGAGGHAGPPVRLVTLVPRCGWPRWSKIESNAPPNLLISRRLVL